jgi:hypothetical protein
LASKQCRSTCGSYTKLNFQLYIFSILGHQTLDPDPASGSGIRIRN